MTNRSLMWIGSVALGVLVMYLFDPIAGRRRRALLRDKAVRFTHQASDRSEGLLRDLGNRAAGVRAELFNRGDTGPVDDTVLEARVRSALGRVSSHPGSIGVSSVNGIVTLTGPLLTREHEDVSRAVCDVPGVV